MTKKKLPNDYFSIETAKIFLQIALLFVITSFFSAQLGENIDVIWSVVFLFAGVDVLGMIIMWLFYNR